MQKIIIITLILVLLLPIIANAKIQLQIPTAELACYVKYPSPSGNYSFKLDTTRPEGITNETIETNGTIKTKVIIHDFKNVCNYSSNSEACFDCIQLKTNPQTTNNTNDQNQQSDNKNTALRTTLTIMVVVLALILVYLLLPKKKIKSNKK